MVQEPADPFGDINPGLLLRQLLERLYPPDSQPDAITAGSPFTLRVDNALMSDGELAFLMYNSAINYMVRRLITAAHYFRKKSEGNDLIFREKLRSFLRDYTRLSNNAQSQVLALLPACTATRKKEPSDTTKRRIREQYERRKLGCYICGREIDYSTSGPIYLKSKSEVEHVWPKSLGGISLESNLALACSVCNQRKRDFIDASDFHYEEISLITDESDESFDKDLPVEYRIAVAAKSEFKCAECGKPASEQGELYFARRDQSDSSHFLNIQAYCSRHIP